MFNEWNINDLVFENLQTSSNKLQLNDNYTENRLSLLYAVTIVMDNDKWNNCVCLRLGEEKPKQHSLTHNLVNCDLLYTQENCMSNIDDYIQRQLFIWLERDLMLKNRQQQQL